MDKVSKQEAWEQFFRTGAVQDYLLYKQELPPDRSALSQKNSSGVKPG